MLTIRTNMNYKCLRPFLQTGNVLSEKIRAAYELMPAQLNAQELRHLLEEPLNTVVQVTNFPQQANVYHQIIKNHTDNHLLNLMLNFPFQELTYQDRVFLHSMLSKAGVKNKEKFLRQFRQEQLKIRAVHDFDHPYRFVPAVLSLNADRPDAAEKTEGADSEETFRQQLELWNRRNQEKYQTLIQERLHQSKEERTETRLWERLMNAETKEIFHIIMPDQYNHNQSQIRPVSAEQFMQEIQHIQPAEISQQQSVMMHKRGSNTVNRQMLQELYRQQKSLSETVELIGQSKAADDSNWQNEDTSADNYELSAKLSDEITARMQSQINHISEQVYHHMEKRLDLERRRRGY